ncbi:DUF4115 domain-containing protein [Roseomonas sp. NAR14]|uniref:DUF4115 domain-containing protein n=1 Tax=Roseomonas acroporae TaxID=2937791 RepID=A0A9X1YFZ2_9PROT|nr:DUF4115 domain-containing protein [Roseomonas acroporae]
MPYDLKRLPTSQTAAGEPARVGEELRDTRMSLGYSVEEVAEALRIRRAYLIAIEEGRVADLPGPAYAVGFVRAYARALGLDEQEMVRRFRDHSGAAVKARTALVFPEPVPERGVPAGVVMLVGAVLAIGAYAGWYHWSGSGDRTVDAVPPLPSRLEQAAPQPAPAAMPPAAPAVGPTPAAPPAPTGLAAAPPRPAPPPVVPPVSAPMAPPAVPVPPPVGFPPGTAPGGAPAPTQAQAATVPAAPVAPVPAPAAPPPAAPEAPATRIQLRGGSGRVWVQVRDTHSNQTLINRTLNPGETYDVPPREGLVLNVGAAQSLDLLVDGQAAPALTGAVGARRGVPLDPEVLKAGPLRQEAAPRPAPTPRPAAPATPRPAARSAGESEADALMNRMNPSLRRSE